MDAEQRVLLRQGQRVPLSPRPFAMLLMLVENRQRIVSRDELMERVWDGVIVEETNIATNIARLRRALANGQTEKGDGDARQYIKTISGYGYQFVAEVREREVAETQPPPPALAPVQESAPPPIALTSPPAPIVPPPPLPFYRNPRYLPVAGTVGIALAILTGLTLRPKPPFIDPAQLNHRAVVSWKNRFGDTTLYIRPSPDGQMVAYSKSEAEQADIFIQEVGKQNPTRITNDPGRDFGPVWAPDGKQIAYQSDRGNIIELAVIDLLTRQRKVVGTFPAHAREHRLLRWSRKTPRLIYTDEKNIFALSLDTQATVKLTNFKEEQGGPSQFGLALDEEQIAYVKTLEGKPALFVARLDGGEAVQLIHAGAGMDYPEWFGDNQHIAYRSVYGGAGQVSVISARGGKPIQLTAGREAAALHHLSPDGKKIFYTVERIESELFRCEVATGAETELASGPDLKAWPEVAPDGQTLVFQRTDDDTKILQSLILSASLAAPSQLPVELAASGFDARWSPHSDRLAFLRRAEKGYQLWLLALPHGTPRLLTEEIALQQGFMHPTLHWHQPCNYSWSPDGSQLAFPARAANITNILTLSADGSVKTQRTQNADPKLRLLAPLWSPDGTRLAYLAQTALAGKSPRSIIVNDGARDRTILRTELPVRMIGWADDGRLLAAVMEPAKPMLGALTLQKISLAGAAMPEVLDQSLPVYLNSLRLSPDRKTLALTARQNDCDDVWLYTLTTRQLRKLTANKESHLHLTGLSWLPDSSALCFSKQSAATAIWVMEQRN